MSPYPTLISSDTRASCTELCAQMSGFGSEAEFLCSTRATSGFDPQPTCSGPRYRAPSDVLGLSRSVFPMRNRMEAISATARIHHTSCRRCPYWTVDGYRSDTQGLPPRYADRGSADESRERGCRGAHRRADAARLHARSKPDIRSPWCGGQNKPNAATNAGTKESQ